MKVKDLIKELQKLPEDAELGIYGQGCFEAPEYETFLDIFEEYNGRYVIGE